MKVYSLMAKFVSYRIDPIRNVDQFFWRPFDQIPWGSKTVFLCFEPHGMPKADN